MSIGENVVTDQGFGTLTNQSGTNWKQWVIDVLTEPPGSPVENGRYAVNHPATGAFAGHEYTIAVFHDGGYTFESVSAQDIFSVRDGMAAGMAAQFTGTEWTGWPAGGGGGGGGGAPTDAKYLLYDAGTPGSLSHALAIGSLPFEKLPFIYSFSPGSNANQALFPIQLEADLSGGYNFTTGGGVGLIFRIKDQANPGGTDYGSIRFIRNSGVATDVGFHGITGDPIATIQGNQGNGQGGGLRFLGTGYFDITTTGNNPLRILTEGSGHIMVRTNGHDVAKFSTGYIEFQEAGSLKGMSDVTVQSATGSTLTLTNANGNSGVQIKSGDTTPVQIMVNNHAWAFDSTAGDLSGPGTHAAEIKNIKDGTTPQSAATVNQVTNAISGASSKQTINFGATTTGTTSQQRYLLYGPPYGPAAVGGYTDTIFRCFRSGTITAGHMYAVTGPDGDILLNGTQTYRVFVNNVDKLMTATDHVNWVGSSVPFVGGPVNFNAGDLIQIVSDVGADVTTGALKVSVFLDLSFT